MSDEELRGWIGTLDPARAVRIQRAYPLAFFDQHLRGRRRHLLKDPSPTFPEVKSFDEARVRACFPTIAHLWADPAMHSGA